MHEIFASDLHIMQSNQHTFLVWTEYSWYQMDIMIGNMTTYEMNEMQAIKIRC